ncbi:MAG: pentapeptide repeat-containing protein [Chlorobiaceae bacterium]|nr:pentapeptide repeat-containing protein [Chlorobiaceae bacterium]NTW74683.1 pentapeptide repeat-containing protein [Chlorobiaceae bacterium]
MKTNCAEPAVNAFFEKISLEDLDPACLLYEECRFSHSSFVNAKLSGMVFRNCLFETCDLSLASFRETSLQEVRFLRCKLLGVQFSECRKLMLRIGFNQCMLRLSVFNNLDLRNTVFEECDLQEADFTEADLAGTRFTKCNLSRTTFFRTNLERADFRSAFGYSLAPESNHLKKAKFTMPEVLGLLDSYGIEIE